MKKQLKVIGLLLISGVIAMSSCKKDDKKDNTDNMPDMPTNSDTTIYEKLGGTTMVMDPNSDSNAMIEKGRLGIRGVVDSTIFVIAGDTALAPYFQVLLAEVGNNDLSGFNELSENLTDFFCLALGAENFEYMGKHMKEAHDPATNSRMGQKADSTAFNAFVGDLVTGAKQNNVPVDIINEIGAVVQTLEGTIVQR